MYLTFKDIATSRYNALSIHTAWINTCVDDSFLQDDYEHKGINLNIL